MSVKKPPAKISTFRKGARITPDPTADPAIVIPLSDGSEWKNGRFGIVTIEFDEKNKVPVQVTIDAVKIEVSPDLMVEVEHIPTLYDLIEITPELTVDENMRVNAKTRLLPATYAGVGGAVAVDELIEKVWFGSLWLDENYPPRAVVIDPENMVIGESSRCMLALASKSSYGQCFDKHRLTLEKAASYGFHPGTDYRLSDITSRVLTLLWLVQLKYREKQVPST